MKLLAPVSRLDEIEAIIEAGADELYCGVLPADWQQRYPAISISRRQAQAAHFKNFEELKSAIQIAHNLDTKIYFTFNAHYFILEQYELIKRYLKKLAKLNIDAIFISDLALLLYAQKYYPQLQYHISTGGNTLNSESAKFFQSLGAKRVILERHLILEEIEAIVKHTTIETEVFIFGSKCPNIDGLCTFHHGFLTIENNTRKFGNACMMPFEITTDSPKRGSKDSKSSFKLISSQKRQHIWTHTHIDDRPCGICALYDLKKIGITSVKIVGRANPGWKKVKDTTFLNNLLKFLDKKPNREKFIQVARISYYLTYERPCRYSMCYFPEVM